MLDRRSLRSAIPVSCWFSLIVCLSSPAVPSVAADVPPVQFDMVPLVACREVSTEEFVSLNPDERLFSLDVDISTLVDASDAGQIQEYQFRVTSPGQRLRIVDYSPKTSLSSEYASTISVEKKDESTRSMGITVSGILDHLVKISGAGDVGSKKNLALRYELQAPQEAVTASGTIHRGSGVYFKLRPSSQVAFEGSRRFSFVFRAPRSWRGDYLRVHCEAIGTRLGVVRSWDESVPAGTRDFFVSLYRAGDPQAKALAQAMVEAESALQASLRRYHRRSVNRPVFDQFVSLLTEKEPDTLPMQQIEQVLFSGTGQSGLPTNLPQDLSQSLSAYLDSRESLRSLQ